MNGRIYDADTGRFMQADPFIQAPSNIQSYNAYSYVLNNPLSRIDPSGYISFNPFKKVQRNLIRGAAKMFGAEMVSVVGSIAASFCAPACSAYWSYEFTRAMGGSSSQAFKAGAIAGLTAAAFQQVGEHFKAKFGITKDFGFGDLRLGQQLQWAGSHALVGGVSSVASGGKFGHGFISAGFTKMAMGNAGFNMNNRDWTAIAGRTTVAAIVGGTASAITGGKFSNGARTAAMMHLLNAEGPAARRNQVYKSFYEKYGDILEAGNIDITRNVADANEMSLQEFVDAVKTGGKWDYKSPKNYPFLVQEFGSERMDDFGNVHFGIVAAASGHSLAMSMYGAGQYQAWKQKGGNHIHAIISSAGRYHLLNNESATNITNSGWTWGDNPGDSISIMRGHSFASFVYGCFGNSCQ